jgi:hypothetical protein
MLSAKGRVCNNKVVIVDKMTALRNKLQGYIDQGLQKVQKRETDANAAKQAWLDAEGAYLIAKKKAETLDLQVAEDLKKVASLTELLDLHKKRLAKVRASVTEQLSEIDEEEAIIKELLGYVGDLTSSTVVVRASSESFLLPMNFSAASAHSPSRRPLPPSPSRPAAASFRVCTRGRMSRLWPSGSAGASPSSCSARSSVARAPTFRPTRSATPPLPTHPLTHYIPATALAHLLGNFIAPSHPTWR